MLILFVLAAFGDTGWTCDTLEIEPLVTGISDLVVDPEGHVYFLDGRESKIHHLDPKGQPIGAFGNKGQGPGEFKWTRQLAYLIEPARVAVVDYQNDQVHLFTPEGRFDRALRLPNRARFQPLRIIDTDHFVFVDEENPFKPDFEENKGARFVVASFEDLEDERMIYSHDARHHADPALVKTEGGGGSLDFSWMPTSLLDLSRNRLIVVGSTREVDFRLYVPGKDEPVATIRDEGLGFRPLTREEIKASPGAIIINGERHSAVDFEQPDVAVPIAGVRFDARSRLWVELNRPRHENHPERYRIYDIDKGLVGTLELAAGERLFWADESSIYCTRREEDDLDERILVEKRAYTLEQ